MNLPNIKILDEKNKILRTISKDVTFPIDEETKKLIYDAITYLEMSQDDDIALEYDLRAGMGLAFIQMGIPKRIFVIANKDENSGKFEEHIIINPTIVAQSEELVYVGEGEGCLSVNRPVDGIVPRHARITVKYNDIEGKEKTVRVREDIAVAFQHEIDHLNGILFVDKIDKKNPYKNKEKMREI
ncbi:MAG: peptide deformylase [Bacilli bacterium]|nr:peptide deformylase [Bacilli bacterium]